MKNYWAYCLLLSILLNGYVYLNMSSSAETSAGNYITFVQESSVVQSFLEAEKGEIAEEISIENQDFELSFVEVEK